MRTHVIEREELVIDVEESNLLALHVNKSSLPGPDLVGLRDFHIISHTTRPCATCPLARATHVWI